MARAPLPAQARGASAVTIALALLVLGGFAALVLNVGRYMMVRGQLQNATDAAALAGALELDGTPAGLARARAVAADYAARHATDRDVAVTIDPASDVIFGHWDREAPKASAFTPIADSEPNAAQRINALRVKAGREQTRGNPLEVFFPVFSGGKTAANASMAAVATGGGPCDDVCGVPLVLADCVVRKPDGSLACGETLVFHDDGADNVGFTNLTPYEPSVNTHDIIQTLRGSCREVGYGDPIGVSNGNNLNNNVVKAFEDYFLAHLSRQITIPIVSPPGGCEANGGPKFNGLQPVVGFATFTVVEVIGPPNQSITIQLDCDQSVDDANSAGCGYFGTVSPKPALVR